MISVCFSLKIDWLIDCLGLFTLEDWLIDDLLHRLVWNWILKLVDDLGFSLKIYWLIDYLGLFTLEDWLIDYSGLFSLIKIRTVMKQDGGKTEKLEKLIMRIGIHA